MLRRDPDPGVPDHEVRPSLAAGQRQPCPAPVRVAGGIAEQVRDDSCQGTRIADHQYSRLDLQGQPQALGVEQRLGLRGGPPYQIVELHKLAVDLHLAAIRARQREQVLDDPGHPLHLLLDRAEGGLVCLDRAPPAQGHLYLALQDSQGGAQLVGSIGGELPLAAERPFQAIQHGVEGARQPAHLVVARRQAQPFMQVPGPDQPGGAGDPIDRSQRASGQERATGTAHQYQDGHRQQQRREHATERRVRPSARPRHLDDECLVSIVSDLRGIEPQVP